MLCIWKCSSTITVQDCPKALDAINFFGANHLWKHLLTWMHHEDFDTPMHTLQPQAKHREFDSRVTVGKEVLGKWVRLTMCFSSTVSYDKQRPRLPRRRIGTNLIKTMKTWQWNQNIESNRFRKITQCQNATKLNPNQGSTKYVNSCCLIIRPSAPTTRYSIPQQWPGGAPGGGILPRWMVSWCCKVWNQWRMKQFMMSWKIQP